MAISWDNELWWHLQDVRDPERDYRLAKHLVSLHSGAQTEECMAIALP